MDHELQIDGDTPNCYGRSPCGDLVRPFFINRNADFLQSKAWKSDPILEYSGVRSHPIAGRFYSFVIRSSSIQVSVRTLNEILLSMFVL